jgi:hypothetical protein
MLLTPRAGLGRELRPARIALKVVDAEMAHGPLGIGGYQRP